MALTEQITGFVQNVVNAMGLTLTPRVEETDRKSTRLNSSHT